MISKIHYICNKCDKEVQVSVNVTDNEDIEILILPCENCLEDSREKGYTEGYNFGCEDGENLDSDCK